MTKQPRRRTALAALTIITMMTTQVLAGPRSVQVLPIDGNADAATRKKITASVQKLARVIDGKLELGTTTFADTAAAVGCDPATPSCAESVRTTLDVDELVYGTATMQNGQVMVVVRRKAAGSAPREQMASMSAQDSPDRIEPTLLPLFTGKHAGAELPRRHHTACRWQVWWRGGTLLPRWHPAACGWQVPACHAPDDVSGRQRGRCRWQVRRADRERAPMASCAMPTGRAPRWPASPGLR